MAVIRKGSTPDDSEKKFKRRSADDRAIGPITFLVLSALEDLAPRECFGPRIAERVSVYLDVVVDLAQVYVTLRRLALNGLIIPKQEGRQAKGPGALTTYRLSKEGAAALSDARAFYERVAAAGRTR